MTLIQVWYCTGWFRFPRKLPGKGTPQNRQASLLQALSHGSFLHVCRDHLLHDGLHVGNWASVSFTIEWPKNRWNSEILPRQWLDSDDRFLCLSLSILFWGCHTAADFVSSEAQAIAISGPEQVRNHSRRICHYHRIIHHHLDYHPLTLT